jgi:hypothetical protein
VEHSASNSSHTLFFFANSLDRKALATLFFKVGIERFPVRKVWYRYKKISPYIANKGFNYPLLIGTGNIAKATLKKVMAPK